MVSVERCNSELLEDAKLYQRSEGKNEKKARDVGLPSAPLCAAANNLDANMVGSMVIMARASVDLENKDSRV